MCNWQPWARQVVLAVLFSTGFWLLNFNNVILNLILIRRATKYGAQCPGITWGVRQGLIILGSSTDPKLLWHIESVAGLKDGDQNYSAINKYKYVVDPEPWQTKPKISALSHGTWQGKILNQILFDTVEVLK